MMATRASHACARGRNGVGVAASKLLAASAHVAPATLRNTVSGGGGIGGRSCDGTSGSDCVVEVTDLKGLVPGDPESNEWSGKVKIKLHQFFKKFGPVMEVRIPTVVAQVRFASAKSASAVMRAAPRGYVTLGEGEVRVRLPGASEAVWRKFPQLHSRASGLGATEPAKAGMPPPMAKKRKLRPNERFSARLPGREDEPDDSERFWEEQRQRRQEPAPPLPSIEVEPPSSESQPAPERPVPRIAAPDATSEDIAVCQGQEKVAVQMAALLDLPFTQQTKALKVLRRSWHPDKRPDDQEVATRVFQFIQAHDNWLAHHGLA